MVAWHRDVDDVQSMKHPSVAKQEDMQVPLFMQLTTGKDVVIEDVAAGVF